MRVDKIYCDRCEDEIVFMRSVYRRLDNDLCEQCRDDFDKMVSAWLKNEPGQLERQATILSVDYNYNQT